MKIINITRKLSEEAKKLKFSSPAYLVYNPLDYAFSAHKKYLEKYGRLKGRIILVGMNPGPFGMAQTGVPFGDVKKVTDFLKIKETINIKKVKNQHPKRPIHGFECKRSEISGTRIYSWAEKRFGSAENFFKFFFIVNYCPLVFMTESGKNMTPDKLTEDNRKELYRLCDKALLEFVRILEPKMVIGIGVFAYKRLIKCLKGTDTKVGKILHPSPASPKANRGWARQVEKEIRDMGLHFILRN